MLNMDRSFIFSGVHYLFLRYDKTVTEDLLYSGHTKQNSSPTVGQKERENTMTMTMDLTGIVFYAANFMKKEMAL